ncbi:unnamed protein product [Closterium sp. NIES-53]
MLRSAVITRSQEIKRAVGRHFASSAAAAAESAGKSKVKAKSTGGSSGGKKKALEDQGKAASIVEAALRHARVELPNVDEATQEEERRMAKDYSRLMMQKHHQQRGAESARLKLKLAAIQALPAGKLRDSAMLPDFTPFPSNRIAPSLTPPIKELQEERARTSDQQHPARCAALQHARRPALQRTRCPARAPAASALPAAVPARCLHSQCAACARLACAAAAAKLLLPLASSVPCPAVGCCAAAAACAAATAALLLLLLLLRCCYCSAAAAAKLLLPPELLLPPALLLPPVLAPKAPAEPAANAGEEVRAHGTGGSGGGGHQELEPSCVAACAPTSTVYAHPSTVLSCLVVSSASSDSTEGGDPTAADTATSRRSPRLETPPGFPPRTSSPPLQSVLADFGGPGVVGGGDAGGAGSRGAASGGARSHLVGGVGGTGAGGAGAGGAGAGGAGAGGAGAGGAGSGGALQSLPRRPIFLEQPLSSLPEPTPTYTTPPLPFPPPDSPLPAPARYVPLSVSLTGRQEPVSCVASLAPSRVSREPVVLPLPPPSSLPAVSDPVSDLARAARPTIPRCLAALVTAPASSPAASCVLVAELAGFAATCRRAYLVGLVSASSCPPSVGGELALGCDVLEDRQFELEYLPYPHSIQTRYVAPGRHHPAH